MDDGRLVAAVLRGQRSEFGVLVERYQRALVHSARLLTRNAEDAEDLAQETLVDAYRNLGTLRDQRKFRAWLFGILRHKCLRHLQRRRPEELHLEDWQETLSAPAPVSNDELLPLLESLPLGDREVLVARYLHELSFADIATLLGISVSAAETRCRRARERLRALVDDQDEARTRQLLAGLLALPISHSFSGRVLREVSILATTTTKSTAVGSGILALLCGWQGAVMLGAVLLIGGGIAVPVIHHAVIVAQAKELKAKNYRTVQLLKADVLPVLIYCQSHNDMFPKMNNLADLKQVIAMTDKVSDASFISPVSGHEFKVNTALSGTSLDVMADPAQIPMICDAFPARDGTHWVVYCDGHLNNLTAVQWKQMANAYSLR
jgi:RNA polymerase sigma-70 factor (ECF subfamily)